MRKTKKTNGVFRKGIIFILIGFFTLSITKAATIPDGLTLIRANIGNAVQYIKQSIFTSSGINSGTKLMDINANSGYIWINQQLLNTGISFNGKVLSLNQNGYLIYSDVPFSSGAQSSGDIYVNGISFDSGTNILTLHMHGGGMVTGSLEGILPTGVLGDTPYRDGNKWITNNPYIFNLGTGAVGIGPNRSDSNRPHVCEREGYEGLDIDGQLRIRNIPYVIRNWSEILVLEKEADENLCNGDSQGTVKKLDRKKIEERLTRITSLENTKKCANGQILQYSVSTKVGGTNERVCVDPCCLEGIKYNPDTNLLTLSTQNNQTFTETIDTWRKKDKSDNYIYNYNNDDYKVHIGPNKGNPEAQLEIKTDSTEYNNGYNLLLKTYDKGDKNDRFAGLFFGVNENTGYKAAITFMRDNYGNNKKYGLGELRFSLDYNYNYHFNTEKLIHNNSDFHIMRMRHLYNNDNKTRKGAVGINTELTITGVALDINDTMRLEPRIMNNTAQFPFECKETTLGSIFMYKHVKNGTEYTYPCFCGVIGPENGYNWYAMGLGNMQLCGSGHGLEYP